MSETTLHRLRLAAPHLSAARVAIAAEVAGEEARKTGRCTVVAEMELRRIAFWTLASGTDGCQWDRRR